MMLMLYVQDEDEAEFQLRRREMFAVQRCEADKIRRRLEQDKLQLHESVTSYTDEDISPLTVCDFWFGSVQFSIYFYRRPFL